MRAGKGGKPQGSSGKRLEGNGLWESSRMMLPEHREAILADARVLHTRIKPELDEQRKEEMARLITDALSSGVEVEARVFRAWGDEWVRGMVIHADHKSVELEDAWGERRKLRWSEIMEIATPW